MKKICQTTDQVRSHHYTVKSQTLYLKMLKEVSQPDIEAVILLDFPEKQLFLYQDSI
jgi:hypothetical protein